MTDIQKLKALAVLAQEQHTSWVEAGRPWPIWNSCMHEMHAAANPAAVLELISKTEEDAMHMRAFGEVMRSQTEQIDQLKAENTDLYATLQAAKGEIERLKGECEALRATSDLKALLPDLGDALEDLELHGRHSDQGYRKLKDWYRKVALAYRVIDGPMFGAEHGELVSQNTWLRSVIERYAQQHAPLEPIPDREGWSTRLPGYDLPALLRDAERYRWLRKSGQYDWDVNYGKLEFRIETPCDDASDLDGCIDAAMSKEASHG